VKKIAFLFLCVTVLTGAYCQEDTATLPEYYTYADYLLAPPGQMDIGLYGFINPAILTHVHGFDMLLTLSGMDPELLPVEQWGFFSAMNGLGFGVYNTRLPGDQWLSRYRISSGFGTNAMSAGIGYEWTTGGSDAENSIHHLTYGLLSRPIPQLSFGLSGNVNTDLNGYEVAVELGIRPLGNNILTLFSDYAFTTCDEWEDIFEGEMSLGLVARLPFWEGFYLSGRYYPGDSSFSAGVKFSTGPATATYLAHFNDELEFGNYIGTVRTGLSEANGFEDALKGSSYMVLNLYGYIDYQVHSLFYKPNTLLEILGNIQTAKNDPIIEGIVVNTAGMYADREKLWEIREALKDFKSTGKKVVIYLEAANIDYYFFASIADKIICDPMSIVTLDGYMLGMSFYKGMLEKAGIGFEELRLFKYKSAYESYSRDKMSDLNREQSVEYIEGIYDYTKKEICEARGFSGEEYEKFVNEISFFTAEEALKYKLIDAVGRYTEVSEEINGIQGKVMNLIHPDSLPERNRPFSVEWGLKRKIAVIYAIGISDMESGIAVRHIVGDINRAAFDPSIKAVVIRIDSPGGSAVAGDVFAEAVKTCRKYKPVIVSQGYIAASAGYWMSMYGNKIVSSPYTLTGSIGVAGGWFYDNGLKEKLGITTDFVKKGEYADLGFGFTVPFIYMGLPDRNLNQGEREMFEKYMSATYDEFIKKVAEGRHQSEEEIDAIAQGRVWSGLKAKENGLIDEIGTLYTAIEIAKQEAGIPLSEKVVIVEYPEFDISSYYAHFFNSIGLMTQSPDPVKGAYTSTELFAYRMKHNGEPLPIIDIYTTDLLGPYFALHEAARNNRSPEGRELSWNPLR
jgi:protease IV